jgi:hypothetical protein
MESRFQNLHIDLDYFQEKGLITQEENSNIKKWLDDQARMPYVSGEI